MKAMNNDLYSKFRKCKTQKESVILYLEWFGEITPKEAMEEFGIWRLSAIIYNLRHKEKIKIETELINTVNRFGNDCNYAKYKL